MLAKNKGKLIASSLVILLPVLAGLLLWDQLPEQMVSHWNAAGEPDGWASRGFSVAFLPLLLLAMHWLCIFITVKDPKQRSQSPKAFALVIWIMPVISVMLSGFVYAIALGKTFSALNLMNTAFGLMFLILGNYMPKIRQNHTLGIKIAWTLQSEDNWNATHRFAGKVWIAAGLIVLLGIFLPGNWTMAVFLIAAVPAVALPMLYSWRYHKKEQAEGTLEPLDMDGFRKRGRTISIVMTVVVSIVVAALMFTGDIHTEVSETALTIQATYEKDLTVNYDSIDSIELRENGVDGTRIMGFGSPRLLMGTFHNEEFGDYLRYTYTRCPSAIVIRSGDQILVLSGKDESATRALYEQLPKKQ